MSKINSKQKDQNLENTKKDLKLGGSQKKMWNIKHLSLKKNKNNETLNKEKYWHLFIG